MRRRGHDDDTVETVFYDNPCFFLGQSPRFALRPRRPRAAAWGAADDAGLTAATAPA